MFDIPEHLLLFYKYEFWIERRDKMVEKNNSKESIANEKLLRQLLDEDKIQRFREQFLAIHPYDHSQFYEHIGPNRGKFYIVFYLRKWLTYLKR